MTCEEFLARHSDYLDEALGADGAAEMRGHVGRCARCARYDRVLRRGLALVRELEPVRPSTDAYVALHEHLARSAPLPPERGVPRASLAATIAVAGVVALLAWSALFRATGVPAAAAGETVRPAPATGVAGLFGDGSSPLDAAPHMVAGLELVLPVPRTTRPARPSVVDALAPVRLDAADALVPTRGLFLPGPYTPLRLQPPDYGQGGDVLPVSAAPR